MKAANYQELLGQARGFVENPWLIEGLLPKKSISLIVAPPKHSKSLLALYLMQCLAAGGKAFGKFSIPSPVTSLLISEEDSGETILTRLAQIRAGHGFDEASTARLSFLVHAGVRIDDPKSLALLREEIGRIRPSVIWWDTLNRFHSQNDNSQRAATAIMAVFDGIRRDFGGCSQAVLHHAAKGAENKSGGAKIRGSGVFHGFVESGIYLDREGELLRVEVESKFAAPDPFFYRLNFKEDSLQFEYLDTEQARKAGEPWKSKFLQRRERDAAREAYKKHHHKGGR